MSVSQTSWHKEVILLVRQGHGTGGEERPSRMVLAAPGPLLIPPPSSPPKPPIHSERQFRRQGQVWGVHGDSRPAQKGLPSREVAVQRGLGPEGFGSAGIKAAGVPRGDPSLRGHRKMSKQSVGQTSGLRSIGPADLKHATCSHGYTRVLARVHMYVMFARWQRAICTARLARVRGWRVIKLTSIFHL
jgi:hypothetical protein